MVTVRLTDEQVADILEQLPPERRLEVLLRIAERAASRRDERMRLIEDRVRQLSRDRGLDWDRLTDQEKETFVDDLIHEDRDARRRGR